MFERSTISVMQNRRRRNKRRRRKELLNHRLQMFAIIQRCRLACINHSLLPFVMMSIEASTWRRATDSRNMRSLTLWESRRVWISYCAHSLKYKRSFSTQNEPTINRPRWPSMRLWVGVQWQARAGPEALRCPGGIISCATEIPFIPLCGL